MPRTPSTSLVASPRVSVSTVWPALALAGVTAVTALGCGAATGLEVPEPPPSCVAGPTPLEPRPLDTLLVIDRSESMLERMSMHGVPDARRFQHLRRAVDTISTQLDADRAGSNVGAMFFPRSVDRHVCEPTTEIWCSVNLDVELAPRPRAAAAVMTLFDGDMAQGGSPMTAALQVARRWLRGQSRPGAARALVLFTDGHSNCNPDPSPADCECEDRDPIFLGPPPCTQSEGVRHWYCVDTARSTSAISQLVDGGIETFVVGVVERENSLAMSRIQRLTNAATAVGETPGERTRFFHSDDASQAATAVRGVTQCQWVLPAWATPAGGAEPELTFAGRAPLARDPSHRNGWDWVDRTSRAVRVYGPACTASVSPESPSAAPRAPTVERSCRVE